MNQKLVAVLGLIVAAALQVPGQSAEGDYAVVVHSQNSVSSMTRSELGALYLKKTARWKDGTAVEPVDLNTTSVARARFSQDVLGKSVPAIQAYWRKLIFSGQGIPPVEFSQDMAVLEYVGKRPGAIGYVSAGADTRAANVKKVRVTD